MMTGVPSPTSSSTYSSTYSYTGTSRIFSTGTSTTLASSPWGPGTPRGADNSKPAGGGTPGGKGMILHVVAAHATRTERGAEGERWMRRPVCVCVCVCVFVGGWRWCGGQEASARVAAHFSTMISCSSMTSMGTWMMRPGPPGRAFSTGSITGTGTNFSTTCPTQEAADTHTRTDGQMRLHPSIHQPRHGWLHFVLGASHCPTDLPVLGRARI